MSNAVDAMGNPVMVRKVRGLRILSATQRTRLMADERSTKGGACMNGHLENLSRTVCVEAHRYYNVIYVQIATSSIS